MDYNDYELVELAQNNNEEAINVLHKKYKNMIERKAKEVYKNSLNKGIDLEDLIQESLIGFGEAIDNYDQNNNVLFYTFANICIDRQLNTEITRINRDKHKLLNEAISLDINKDGETKDLLNIITDNDTPESNLISLEEENELIDKIKIELTDLESDVFDLKRQGFSYKEIANILNKDDKAVDNAMQRIKNKLKVILNN